MYEVLSHLSSWSVVLPFIIGIVRMRHLDTDSILILLLVTCATIPQMIHVYNPRSTPEVISYNVYTITEFIIYFFLFYYKSAAKSWRTGLVTIFFLYFFMATYFIYRDGIDIRFINELAVSNGIIYLIIIGFYLYQTMLSDQGDLTPLKPFFWFTVGILLYAACTTLVYSLWQRILNSPDSVMESLWNLQNVFNILTYVLFAVGLLVAKNNFHKNLPTTLD